MARGGKQKTPRGAFHAAGCLLMVRPGGFEPLAFGVGVQRSIQLSYDRTYCRCFSISKKEYTILLHKLQMEFLWAEPLTKRRGMAILKS